MLSVHLLRCILIAVSCILQVRQLVSSVGLEVTYLKRVRCPELLLFILSFELVDVADDDTIYLSDCVFAHVGSPCFCPNRYSYKWHLPVSLQSCRDN